MHDVIKLLLDHWWQSAILIIAGGLCAYLVIEAVAEGVAVIIRASRAP